MAAARTQRARHQPALIRAGDAGEPAEASEIELTVIAGAAGHDIANRVWYVQEAKELHLLRVGAIPPP